MVKVIVPKLPSPGTEPGFVIAINKPMLGLSETVLLATHTLLLLMRVSLCRQTKEFEQRQRLQQRSESNDKETTKKQVQSLQECYESL